ncbi:hypothetical protein QMO56_20370 [Roseomonas sp. E05]|uniref:hypothetical protein n=1 Tax=Roseomonas sp. E05 TaxID=3046310 RepID=UPI0024BAC249|nr:hypothetical protein [Roseomonas sp. E05]MDJ0390473.1 hypothetical protein [Roseomonas sp. E05]
MSMSFEEKLAAMGLKVPPAELPKLEALVAELAQAAEVVRIARPYLEEPQSAFRLQRA